MCNEAMTQRSAISSVQYAKNPQDCGGRKQIRLGHWSCVMAQAFFLCLLVIGHGTLPTACSQGGKAMASANRKLVKVITQKEGDLTHFFVNNLEGGEVTATFTVAANNLKGSVQFPYTATYPPRQITEAFTLSPIDPQKGWGYSYTNQFTIGNHRAVHDDSLIYLLPYVAGSGFRVTQGYNGSYSHCGP